MSFHNEMLHWQDNLITSGGLDVDGVSAGHYAAVAAQSTISHVHTHTDLAAEYKSSLAELQSMYEDVQHRMMLCF